MKHIALFGSLTLLLAPSACCAQMYTITDLGTLGGSSSSAAGINESGQVVGSSLTSAGDTHGFRTAANSPINPETDDLGTLGGSFSEASGINSSGEVVGASYTSADLHPHAYRTAPNSSINPATDKLDGPTMVFSGAFAINDAGQVVGTHVPLFIVSFRTAPNSPIDPGTDDLGIHFNSFAIAINASGQVAGRYEWKTDQYHAFRTSPNQPINPATDDVGTLDTSGRDIFYEIFSAAMAINDSGQVAGESELVVDDIKHTHAFRTAPNSRINPATDDLEAFGGRSTANGINATGEVVGFSSVVGAFVDSSAGMLDLNTLIPADSGWSLMVANAINASGQIAGTGSHNGQQHAFLITPIYKALVQAPLAQDSPNALKASRRALPVKFTLAKSSSPTCALPAATIDVFRTTGGTLTKIENGAISIGDEGTDFKIDASSCQYVYNLSTSSLGVGDYRVDISINGIMVGHAFFALQ